MADISLKTIYMFSRSSWASPDQGPTTKLMVGSTPIEVKFGDHPYKTIIYFLISLDFHKWITTSRLKSSFRKTYTP